MVEILRRYYAGDASLITEIQSNFTSDAPIAELARDSLAYDQQRKMASMPSAVPSVEQPEEQEDTNEKEEHELPSNEDTNKEEHELPSNEDTNKEEHELPSNEDTNKEEHELPFNEDTNKEEEEVPFENKTSGKKRPEREATPKYDEDLELGREERRLAIAERKQALRQKDQVLHREDQALRREDQALLQDALEHLKTVSEDDSFDDDIRAAIKQRTLKIALDGR